MPEWLTNIPLNFWTVLGEMAPYLLFGFFIAGVLSVFVSPELIERHLGGHGIWPVIKASAFGVPLPLCSCGVIPVAASIRRHGAGKGATTAFLISTPQTGADSIFVTLSLLGGVFAMFRPLAALISGMIGGSIVSAAVNGGAEPAAEKCREACCAGDGGRGKLYRVLSYGFVALPRDIGRALLVGLVIAAVISAAVPKDYFANILGGGLGAMMIMMLLGIPVYVCATASVPVAAALIAAGVSPGAALVFLMTGPATNAATITTVWRVLGRRTAIIYLLTVAGSALAAGLLLDYVFNVGRISATPAMPWMLPNYVKWTCAVVLLVVLGFAAAIRTVHKHKTHVQQPKQGDSTND
ncbi:MAG: SO_0444 family Cu/Zn efflux transporter [Planctomycetota bacterium]|nr:SO_0444 family Cu/Zn efflux transporter [Planctomycetota bacterium]